MDKVRDWLEAGKQIGKSASVIEAGEAYQISIGVQKWEGEYKLYFFKAKESRMIDLNYYDIEGTMRVTRFEEIPGLLSASCPFKLAELAPLKGNRLFNPTFN